MNKIQALNADGKVCDFNGTEWVNPNDTQEENTSKNQPKQFKPKQLRTRRFCISSYIDPTSLEAFVSSLPWVQHWAMTTHNRDINAYGTLKDVHTHILLYTYETKTASAIKKKFDNFSREIYQGTDTEPQNTLVQVCHDMASQWRYLIHKDDLDKAQYDPCERKCDNFSYWNKLEYSNGLTDSKSNIALAIVNDILDGTPTMTMIERYGREYIINCERYKRACASHLCENTRCNNVYDLIQSCLESSRYTKDQIYFFWQTLDYIQKECLLSYGTKIDLLTDDSKYELQPLQERI